MANSFKYEIIIINESWLNVNIKDSLILGNDYDIFRCDRNSTSANNGGGVFIAVKNDLKASLIYKNNTKGFETCWIKLKLYNQLIIIGTIYASPRLDKKCWLNELENILDEILSHNYSDQVFLCGDFNINWAETESKEVRLLQQITSFHGLKQKINFNTHGKSIIDLLFVKEFTNHKEINIVCHETENLISSHKHVGIEIDIENIWKEC